MARRICGHDNRPGARFCTTCGLPLGDRSVAVTADRGGGWCPKGHPNAARSRFCTTCGQPIAVPPTVASGVAGTTAPSHPRVERRVVVLVVSAIVAAGALAPGLYFGLKSMHSASATSRRPRRAIDSTTTSPPATLPRFPTTTSPPVTAPATTTPTTLTPTTTVPTTTAPTTTAPATTTPTTFEVTTEGGKLNVHDEPGADAPVIGTLPNGSFVSVWCTELGPYVDAATWGGDSYWDEISFNGRTGWVSDEFVDTESQFFEIPACPGT